MLALLVVAVGVLVSVPKSEPTSYTWTNAAWKITFYEEKAVTGTTVRASLTPRRVADEEPPLPVLRAFDLEVSEADSIIAAANEFLAMVRRHKAARLTEDTIRPIVVNNAETRFKMRYRKGEYSFSGIRETEVQDMVAILRRLNQIAKEAKRKATF
jgi:hypothetical protein